MDKLKPLGHDCPFVHRVGACSMVDAKTVYDAFEIPTTAPTVHALANGKTFADVKTAFENNYACMGVTCADIGYLHQGVDAGNAVAAACVDSADSSGDGATADTTYSFGSDVFQELRIDLSAHAMQNFLGYATPSLFAAHDFCQTFHHDAHARPFEMV